MNAPDLYNEEGSRKKGLSAERSPQSGLCAEMECKNKASSRSARWNTGPGTPEEKGCQVWHKAARDHDVPAMH